MTVPPSAPVAAMRAPNPTRDHAEESLSACHVVLPLMLATRADLIGWLALRFLMYTLTSAGTSPIGLGLTVTMTGLVPLLTKGAPADPRAVPPVCVAP